MDKWGWQTIVVAALYYLQSQGQLALGATLFLGAAQRIRISCSNSYIT